MSAERVTEVVIVGRDAALWLTACTLQTALSPSGVKITAVELPSLLHAHDVHATLPALEALHQRLRIEESALLGTTGGSFSLGQNFVDTSRATPAFFHAYGVYGAPIEHKPFLPHWLLARRFGLQVALEDFSLTAAAARHGRMLIPDAATEAYGRTDYGYHLPAVEYARVLKRQAVRRGVTVHEALDCAVILNASGDIAAVSLDHERSVAGELFIDCTGAEARLIGVALGVENESWHEYFAVDRVLRACADRFAAIPPYAEIRAWSEGWVGLYPDQARTHIAQVYSSTLCKDEEALQTAVKIAGLNLQDAVVHVSAPSRRTVAWQRNCVAIGESAAVFDPLHSVDLQSVQVGLVHLLSLFPVRNDWATERVEYNRTVQQAYERIRDFQSAFYLLNRYSHSLFWTLARRSRVSEPLAHKLDTFRARGEVPLYENETFEVESWQSLFIGHGVIPETHDPMADTTAADMMKQEFRRILGFIKDKVQEQTPHDVYLRSVCAGRSA